MAPKPRKPPKPMDFTLPDGQRYVQVGAEPHELRSGRAMSLLVLRSECPICGAPFLLKASRRNAAARILSRRCPEHRIPGVTVEKHKARLAAALARQTEAAARRAHAAALLAMFD
ncbi:hypothetical protein [Methylobacterium gossipiicola]|uniref:Uncharacterized protein n=1 Tax=Methylobacterium gossipiicola TaxID=582675 RepID=A0A1I2X5A7_9HYPH|nr:hypothetical protein [Methylobacterium gossipiicola]SFH08724.1 hypothetical protein SAMN05192565_1333 [Methylobacterium gossipiicola]